MQFFLIELQAFLCYMMSKFNMHEHNNYLNKTVCNLLILLLRQRQIWIRKENVQFAMKLGFY